MVLITGATGFLGAELTRQLLLTEKTVRCIKRQTSVIPGILKSYSDRIEWLDVDLLDFADLEEAVNGVTELYHCAAKVSFSRSEEQVMNAVNVEGTANIVNLCLDHQIRLLHVSSVAALGNPKGKEAVTEKNYWDAYDKNGLYAVSKYRSEMEVWRGIEEGLNAVIVNPSVIIGENVGENGSGQIFKLVAKGLRYYTNGTVGLVDVKDVARLMIELMRSDYHSERFLINAENYSYQQFFKEILQASGLHVKQKSIAKWQLSLLSKLSFFGKFFLKDATGISTDIVNAAFNQTTYSNQKIVNALGSSFTPIKTSISQTIASLK